eukprot:5982065-Pleurochrysis_carterae.AAC.1
MSRFSKTDEVLSAAQADESKSKSKYGPSAMLRGKCVSYPAVHTAMQNGWEIYMSYTPGFADNFAAPPQTFVFGVGCTVNCFPPFLSIASGANVAPTPEADVGGVVLGIMLGEVSYQS